MNSDTRDKRPFTNSLSASNKSGLEESTYQLRYNNSKTGDFKATNYMESFQGTEYYSEDNTKTMNHSKSFKHNTVQRGIFGSFWNQTKILLWKNYLLFKRNYKNTIFMLITPILAVLILLALQGLTNYFNNQFVNKKPDLVFIENINNCNIFATTEGECKTIRYSVTTNSLSPVPKVEYDYYEKIISNVAKANNLSMTDDVSLIESHIDPNKYLVSNKNSTSYVITFCYESSNLMNSSIPCNAEYIEGVRFEQYMIHYNHSIGMNDFAASPKSPYSKSPDLLKLKLDLDNAILQEYSNRKSSNNRKKNLLFKEKYRGNDSKSKSEGSRSRNKQFSADANTDEIGFILDDEVLKEEKVDYVRKSNHVSTSPDNTEDTSNQVDSYESYLDSSIPKINYTLSDYPQTKNRMFENADVVTQYGAFYFYFCAMVNFVVILLETVREKEQKLRKSLIIIGLGMQSYWVSWIITSVIFSLATGLVICIMGLICQFDFFLNSNFLIVWIVMSTFILTLQFLSYMLCSFLPNSSVAYTVAYSFIIIGLIMQSIITNSMIVQLLFKTDLPGFVGIVRTLFMIYPPFTFSIIVTLIAKKASYTYDSHENLWRKGEGFSWSDLNDKETGKVMGDFYEIPSALTLYGVFFLNIAIFWVITWYLDHVLEENQGKKYSFFFFLKRTFWCPKQSEAYSEEEQPKKGIINDTPSDRLDNNESPETEHNQERKHFHSDELNRSPKSTNMVNESKDLIDSKSVERKTINDQFFYDESVDHERERVLDSQKKKTLRILGLTKTYNLSTGLFENKSIQALKPTYIEVDQDEVFTIIGHNGAGKTTLINMLTGNIKPTEGSAKVYGLDLLEDNVEQMVGLCPQHDILWEELTAEEHVILYSHLRNIKPELVNHMVKKYLKSVNLDNQQKNEVRTYSGGMKRRLSILLCTIGEPKVVFLDEPTTGLDPVNKRFIWRMVQDIKQGRSVILTTHAMEEAEFLSDRIGVIKEGVFKTIGTSIELKETYGSGYLLTFVVDPHTIEESLEEIGKAIPSGKILNTQGGSVIMNLAIDRTQEMGVFVRLLNKEKDECQDFARLKNLVKDCGMEFTTLEEIFLKITGKPSNIEEEEEK
eukprot:CAMPEP_0170514168 /NCGR_PEP_ID=MMETSP0209-20121228/708_1 /TAXON_ID=665100 ORGANISM="Litonotus pictus, Strain P1" /NCGR_SAMPLE_ID=MMETSP0209 /ASSEMBLY_ACC=CAM_ASM_000301 /LENGTH=1106 /DNA_ID=CAMNT_0010798131 /DNA_START=1 /DNA_END=3321 /DNA_ORIENTATION=+